MADEVEQGLGLAVRRGGRQAVEECLGLGLEHLVVKGWFYWGVQALEVSSGQVFEAPGFRVVAEAAVEECFELFFAA